MWLHFPDKKFLMGQEKVKRFTYGVSVQLTVVLCPFSRIIEMKQLLYLVREFKSNFKRIGNIDWRCLTCCNSFSYSFSLHQCHVGI